MRFLVDECTGPAVAHWLRERKFEVFSVYESSRGMTDDAIIGKAFSEKWILITNDKDFGEKIFRERRPHCGVILLRLDNESSSNKIGTLRRLLDSYADQLAGRFIVATESRVRFASTSSE